jgi:hypothetical protein
MIYITNCRVKKIFMLKNEKLIRRGGNAILWDETLCSSSREHKYERSSMLFTQQSGCYYDPINVSVDIYAPASFLQLAQTLCIPVISITKLNSKPSNAMKI